MKEPSYEDAKRCLEIRKRTKSRGPYIPEDSRFCEKMLKKYPEWYNSTQKEVFNDTVPFGSKARWREYFTAVEVMKKLGQKIRTKVAFSGVPKGTTGTVTGSYGEKEKRLDITWDLPCTADGIPRQKPLVDGFRKDEYEEFLEEI